MMPKYLSTSETAEHLRVSTSWLAKSRLSGEGPPFIKAGRTVLYDLDDIEAWVTKRKRRSTSASTIALVRN
jgi:predicted DNA-binding transcriptional regulator AlpA